MYVNFKLLLLEEYFVIVYFCCLKNYCIVDLCNCKMEMLINENE